MRYIYISTYCCPNWNIALYAYYRWLLGVWLRWCWWAGIVSTYKCRTKWQLKCLSITFEVNLTYSSPHPRVHHTHIYHTHMFTTPTCSHHTHMFTTPTCSTHRHDHHTYMFNTLTCSSHPHVHHTHMFITPTCSPHPRVHHTHVFTTPTCSPHPHIHHTHMFTISTYSSHSHHRFTLRFTLNAHTCFLTCLQKAHTYHLPQSLSSATISTYARGKIPFLSFNMPSNLFASLELTQCHPYGVGVCMYVVCMCVWYVFLCEVWACNLCVEILTQGFKSIALRHQLDC